MSPELIVAAAAAIAACATAILAIRQHRTPDQVPPVQSLKAYMFVASEKFRRETEATDSTMYLDFHVLLDRTLDEHNNHEVGEFDISARKNRRQKKQLLSRFEGLLQDCTYEQELVYNKDTQSVEIKLRAGGLQDSQAPDVPDQQPPSTHRRSQVAATANKSGVRVNKRRAKRATWERHANNFGAESGYAKDRARLMTSVATRWVDFALNQNIHPAVASNQAVNDFLDTLSISPNTMNDYRKILDMWFSKHGL